MSAPQSGPPVVAGYGWTLRVSLVTTDVVFPVGMTAVAHGRFNVPDPDPPAVTLTTENGGITRIDDQTIDLFIDGPTSAAWAAGHLFLDLVRTDASPDDYVGFRAKVPIIAPVTRGLP